MALGEKITANGPITGVPTPVTIAEKLMDMFVDTCSRNILGLLVVGVVLRRAFADETT